MRSFVLFILLIASPAAAHEFWIEPLDYRPGPDSKIAANIVNGQEFEGFRLAYIPRKFATFAVLSGDRFEPVESRIGSTPAMNQPALGDGLHVVVYQSAPETLTYEKFEKFQAFADHKELGDVLGRHRARGLPEEGFKEVYTRFSKSLIGVGGGAGADKQTGMETELVAIDNPYAGDLSDGMRVQLFHAGKVRADVQVELFEKAPGDKKANVTLHRTDIHGIATLPVKPGHEYMVDAVVLREPGAERAEATGAVWESLWANLTFSVPAR